MTRAQALFHIERKQRVPASAFEEIPEHTGGKGLKGKLAKYEGREVRIAKSSKKGQQFDIEWNDKPKDKGALTSLNLSSNDLKAAGAKIVAEAIKDNLAMISPQEQHPCRASPRACEDHAGQGEAHYSLPLEQRRDRA
jgi:hypothetical protein